jgi:hypothetical protein
VVFYDYKPVELLGDLRSGIAPRRSTQWYAPQFKILDHLLISEEDEEVLRIAAAIYTEDASLNRKDCYLIELAEFRRSMLIFPQHRRVRLYLVERRGSS